MKNRNKILIIIGAALIAIAVFLFVLGGFLKGWDFYAFFSSPMFIWMVVLLGLFGCGAIYFLIIDRINKL